MFAYISSHSSTDALSKSQHKLLYSLTLATAIATYVLVVFGNIVRITDSGLGCPDWPFCYGYMLPGPDSKAIIEMGHRYFAGVVSLMIVGIAALAFRWRPGARLIKLCWLTGVLLTVQITLGALTVITLLHEWSVALHLVCGMGVLGCTVAMHLEVRYLNAPKLSKEQINPATKAFRRSLITLAAVVVLLLLTGGLMSGSGSAMACGVQFPLCNGGWLPNGAHLHLRIGCIELWLRSLRLWCSRHCCECAKRPNLAQIFMHCAGRLWVWGWGLCRKPASVR